MIARALARNGLPEDLAQQYAQQAVDNARAGKLVGTMGKVMKGYNSLKSSLGIKPDKPGSGGASKPTR